MIDETREEQAALYVMDRLEPAERAEFESALQSDAELRALVAELEEAAAALAHAAPLHLPPPGLKARVLAATRGETPAAAVRPSILGTARWREYLPWAVAAMFALSTIVFWIERHQLSAERGLVVRDFVTFEQQAATETAALERELANQRQRQTTEMSALRAELDAMRERDALSSMKIATLTAQVDAYARALAVVVWDAKAQQGFLTLDKFPAAGAGKDYQLWVIDPAKKTPVSAGIVPISPTGVARIAFKPDQPISAVGKFAISVERTGGAPSPQGQIVLLGD